MRDNRSFVGPPELSGGSQGASAPQEDTCLLWAPSSSFPSPQNGRYGADSRSQESVPATAADTRAVKVAPFMMNAPKSRDASTVDKGSLQADTCLLWAPSSSFPSRQNGRYGADSRSQESVPGTAADTRAVKVAPFMMNAPESRDASTVEKGSLQNDTCLPGAPSSSFPSRQNGRHAADSRAQESVPATAADTCAVKVAPFMMNGPESRDASTVEKGSLQEDTCLLWAPSSSFPSRQNGRHAADSRAQESVPATAADTRAVKVTALGSRDASTVDKGSFHVALPESSLPSPHGGNRSADSGDGAVKRAIWCCVLVPILVIFVIIFVTGIRQTSGPNVELSPLPPT